MGGTDLTITDPHERVQSLWDFYIANDKPNYDTPFHHHLAHISTKLSDSSTSPGILSTTLFFFTVPASACNTLGTLHGGATSTLFDLTTSIALGAVSRPGAFQYLGVTRTLNVTYLKAVREGMKVVVGNEVVSIGGRLSVIRGWIAESDGSAAGDTKGGLLAVCEHGKVNTDPPIGREQGKGKL